MPKNKKQTEVSELRRDPVSNEWVLIATARSKRPSAYKEKRKHVVQPRKTCPFCNLEKSGTNKYSLLYPINLKSSYARQLKKDSDIQVMQGKEWSLIVVPNLYPALIPGQFLKKQKQGLHEVLPGRGSHEVLITASHEMDIGRMPLDKVEEVFKAYQERYVDLCKQCHVKYISLFHNHGKEAGASLSHPHSQILAIPVIPRDVKSSLQGSRKYFNKNKRCVHCDMMKWEQKKKDRIVYENKDFVVLCPFSSSVSFEIRIYPKRHSSYFEEISPGQLKTLAQCFKVTLNKMYKALGNPPFNFFLHTAPCDGVEKKSGRVIRKSKNYNHYHWHFEIHPKLSTWAGFELSTGLEISTVEPEFAADTLRKTSG